MLKPLTLIIFIFSICVECMPLEHKNVTIKRYYFRLNPKRGSYKFRYVNSDGSYQEATGLTNNDNDDSLTVIGFYGYTAPDGMLYRVSYVADKDGFRPEGDHLPTTTPDPTKIMAEVKRLVVVPSQKRARFRK